MIRVIALLVAGLGVAGAQSAQPEAIPRNNPYVSEADAAQGKRLFGGHCAPCHGPEGTGGRAADLTRLRLPRAPDDAGLFRVIRDGLPGTEMPSQGWQLIDREIWQIAAFVRTLGRAAPEQVPGDAAAGERLLRTRGGCLRCHSVGAEGGSIAPPLTEVGLRRSPKFLRQKLLDPSARLPEDWAFIEAVTRYGGRVSGIRLNEDTFSIQVLDLSGEPHSFWKSELVELKKDASRSPMPSYRGAFSAAELDDLVAYLVSLKGGS